MSPTTIEKKRSRNIRPARRQTPGEVGPEVSGFQSVLDPSITWAVFPTQLGWMACRWRQNLLDANTFGHRSDEAARQAIQCESGAGPCDLTESMHDLVSRLRAYATDGYDEFATIELELSKVTRFQRRVLECCRAIPRGTTLSYADLATKAGHAGAARAVGNVMRANRFPLIVPCHRVVGSAGSIGGYSAPDGLTMKRRLLELEGLKRG